MDTQVPLPLIRPTQPGELDLGEPAPIVSSCGICNVGLRIHQIAVREDGEHVCVKADACHRRVIEGVS